MMKPVARQSKLRYLAAVTAVMLSGIIALQVYWLFTSYTQQRHRFTADIASALGTVALNEAAYQVLNVGNSSDDSNHVSSVVINFRKNDYLRKSKNLVTVTESDEPSVHSGKTSTTIYIGRPKNAAPVTITPKMTDSLLRACIVRMDSELLKREIHVPFELAIIDDKGRMVRATCDTPRFHRIPVKSAKETLMSDGTHARLLLQSAFPDANLYLLRRMIMILSVTTLLIIIGAWSFSYMLVQFFRQKKIADIRNDFMNNMTHELKTPISSALVAMEMVEGKRHPLDEATKQEYMGVAKSELQRLTMLIDKVLNMAAFDHQEIPVSKTQLSAKDLVHEAIHNLEPICNKAGAEITVNIFPETLSVYGDKVHLLNVLQNLLENAVKYNDKAQPLISFDLTGNHSGVTVNVTDNGKGIPQAYVAKVFDKFFRVPSGDIHDVKGYGLGLSYVKAIVTLHGGTATVSSREKEGSIFTIFLPAK